MAGRRIVGIAVTVVIVVTGAISNSARAQPAPVAEAVALLPLDADQRLALYGQPVASEIARALVAGGIVVVVVGPKMAVPARARLVVDGTITGRGDAVTLSIRVRDPRDGAVVDTLSATAPALTSIDRAAEDLSARVLPSVKAHLAALDHPKPADSNLNVVEAKPVAITPANCPELTVSIDRSRVPSLTEDPFTDELAGWAAAHHYRLARDAGNASDATVHFELLDYDITAGVVPFANARVHIAVTDHAHVIFDRIVVTDTIVGDRGIASNALAARTARAVLAILDPHMRQLVTAWDRRGTCVVPLH